MIANIDSLSLFLSLSFSLSLSLSLSLSPSLSPSLSLSLSLSFSLPLFPSLSLSLPPLSPSPPSLFLTSWNSGATQVYKNYLVFGFGSDIKYCLEIKVTVITDTIQLLLLNGEFEPKKRKFYYQNKLSNAVDGGKPYL